MKINFLLPGPSRKPSGGPRVIYEYAKRLVERGHRVNLIHPFKLPIKVAEEKPYLLKYFYYKILRKRGMWWYKFPREVKVFFPADFEEKYIPDADVVVATAWPTAEVLATYPARCGQKFYFIQHYEVWGGYKERVENTYRLPLKKIVISRWLKELMRKFGDENVSYIPNGIDLDFFKMFILPEERNPYQVAMMYHEFDWKGSKDGIEALMLAKKEVKELNASFFSVYPKPLNLPEWITFYKNPSQKKLVEIYNRSAIFLFPSWIEGWGLPGAEAMACGCALISTNNQGVKEYAIDGKNALLSPVKDVEALTQNLIYLLRNREERIRLAIEGQRDIQHFTWERSVSLLEETFKNSI